MIDFNKAKVREALSEDNLFELVEKWGGNPERTSFGFISDTICHNPPGEGSKKLYWYKNTGLFRCFTSCSDVFDIFQLYIKINKIQKDKDIDLNEAVRTLAQQFGISGEHKELEEDLLEDWQYIANYSRIQEIEVKTNNIVLKEYDPAILANFNYDLRLEPWLAEGISQKTLSQNKIGYYLGGDQITIPHFDKDGRFIGLRGRTMCKEEGELYGKYRPLKINGQLYNHPLGFSLYNLNNAQDNIQKIGKAIIFEAEKSTLKYDSFFGSDVNIAVACCGSSISAYQIDLLINSGAKEIIIALDRQFQAIGDAEFIRLKNNLIKLHNKYKNDVLISFIFDKNMITDYKASPIDEGAAKFVKLFKERIIL